MGFMKFFIVTVSFSFMFAYGCALYSFEFVHPSLCVFPRTIEQSYLSTMLSFSYRIYFNPVIKLIYDEYY